MRFSIWLDVNLVTLPVYFSSWFYVNWRTQGSINGSYCCTFMLKYCISIDSDALLAKYDSSSADFLSMMPIFYNMINPEDSYL